MPARSQIIIYLGALVLVCALVYFGRVRAPFPHTFVINLADRKDRMAEAAAEFKAWPGGYERMEAVKAKPGWKGCTQSHLKCIRAAKERGYPWVLYVEDDCVMTSQGLKQFMNVLPYLWEHRADWDIFSGATSLIKDFQRRVDSPPLYQVKGYASHFTLVNGAAYDKILGLIKPDNLPIIDHFYRENMRVWTTAPFIALQRPSTSDIEGGHKDYDSLFAKAEAKLLGAN